jgi:hypothetical protein
MNDPRVSGVPGRESGVPIDLGGIREAGARLGDSDGMLRDWRSESGSASPTSLSG